jgi:hypothetical protein
MKTLFLNFLIIFIFTISSNAQSCFTYDAAGNRVKRQSCVVAISQQETDHLQALSKVLNTDTRSIKEYDDLSEFVVYPNPTSSSFQLTDQNEWNGASLQVLNLEGKVVHTVSITESLIDVSNLPSGTYFLILVNDKFRKTAKLFITK